MPKKAKMGIDDLATVNPELAAQWHPTENGNLKPTDVTAGSNKKVWWLYPYDVPMDYPVEQLRGKHFDFKWKSSINLRNSKNLGCPYISGEAIWEGFNDLATTHPELAAQWHPTKNGNISPKNTSRGYDKKVWWLLPYDVPMDYPVEHLRGKHFDFEWETSIDKRTSRGHGCPYLSGHGVWKGFNDLATVNPELAKQWHPIENKELKPTEVTVSSAKKVWWYFPYDVPMDYPIEHLRGKHFDFEWCSAIKDRNRYGLGCPFLSSQALWKGFNDLATTRPELAKEWHPTKNGDLTPSDVMAGTNKKAWWQHKRENPETGEIEIFEWEALIINRGLKGYGCPYVLNSKGEKEVRKILTDNKILFKEQNTFPDRISPTSSRLLRDDFALFDKYGNVVGTIEFNGRQHYMPVDFAGKGKEWAEAEFKKVKERDKIKSKYLKDHGIKQLIISYKDFNNAPQIVGDFIEELSKTQDLSQPSEKIKAQTNNSKKDIQPWQPPIQPSHSSKEVKNFMNNLLKPNDKHNPSKGNGEMMELKRRELDMNI